MKSWCAATVVVALELAPELRVDRHVQRVRERVRERPAEHDADGREGDRPCRAGPEGRRHRRAEAEKRVDEQEADEVVQEDVVHVRLVRHDQRPRAEHVVEMVALNVA